jgi:arginase family enzyme
MKISDHFVKVGLDEINYRHEFEDGSWFQHYKENESQNQDSFESKKIALIGIDDGNFGKIEANNIRTFLFSLKNTDYADKVIDLGNFHFDYSLKAYQSLGYVLSEIINLNIIPIILNGRNQICFSQYLAFGYLKKYFSLVTIDNRIDFNLKESDELNHRNYLQKIFLQEPSYLFHYSNVGHQIYFEETSTLTFLENLHFDLYRLGQLRQDLNESEPVLRSANCVSFDINSIRQADSPGVTFPSPNGFYNEEACQLTRFAGNSPKVQTIGFYEYDATLDHNHQTAHQIAQMIWFFVDGALNRYLENPLEDKESFVKFITHSNTGGSSIVFYKSKRTNKWWMEVPIHNNANSTSANNQHLIPCSYNDYLIATREEIPDRWWKTMKKFS